MKKGYIFRISVVFLLIIILIFTILNYFSLTGDVVYDATLSNVSENNLTSSSGIAHLNLTDGSLVLYFAMDDNNSLNKIYDYTNSSNDGDLISSPTYISNGLIGGGYNFSGNNNITVSNSLSLNISSEITLSAWVNVNASSPLSVGTVKSYKKINDTSLGNVLDDDDNFGFSVANIGDLDG
ncbi:unnamed protein product, partial [marine sediment metagenome]